MSYKKIVMLPIISIILFIVLIIVISLSNNQQNDIENIFDSDSDKITEVPLDKKFEPQYDENEIFIMHSSIKNPGCIEFSKRGTDTWEHYIVGEGPESRKEGKCEMIN